MPLTQFGKACQQHRKEMKAVMADQALQTGFSSSVISSVEQGNQAVPANYVKKMVEWMQLDRENEIELALLATLNRPSTHSRGKRHATLEESLSSILDRLNGAQPKIEIADGKR